MRENKVKEGQKLLISPIIQSEKVLSVFLLAMLLVAGLCVVMSIRPVSAATPDVNYYLRGTAPNLILDTVGPTGTTAKYLDSPSINRNAYGAIGTWTGAATATTMQLTSWSPLHVWLGLKNSDDQGTNFDLKAEVLKEGVSVAEVVSTNIKGVTRNPDKALEVTVDFSTFTGVGFNQGEHLGLKISAKVTASGGHSSAVGLRLYYDASNRASKFDATTQYLVHYVATGNALAVTVPADEWVNSGGVATGVFPALVTNDGTKCVFVSDDRPLTITGPTTITGTYQTQYQLTLAVNPNVPGGVSNIVGGTDGTFYIDGTVLSLTATTPIAVDSSSEYHFTGWSGGATGTTNPISVTMNAPKSITANYELVLLGQELTALSPANIWVGLKNSDEVGAKFDLKVEVYRDRGGTLTLVGSGEVLAVSGGSSGFNNAVKSTIPLTLTPGVRFLSGDKLVIKVSVRNSGLGHNTAAASLWLDGISKKANSNFDATIGGTNGIYYLHGTSSETLSTTVGTGNPGSHIEVGTNTSTYTVFGTWSITLP